MKTFLKRNKIFFFLWGGIIVALVVFWFFPVDTWDRKCFVIHNGEIISYYFGSATLQEALSSPFTAYGFEDILFFQTIVFALLILALIVSVVLFIIRWKKEHPTKMQRMQSQIDELQKQVDDLTSTK